MQEAEPTAFGILHLSPDQFGRMTPGEFSAAIRGAEEETRGRQRLAAWAVSWIINGVGCPSTPVTPDQLLKPPPAKPGGSLRENHERIKRRFGVK